MADSPAADLPSLDREVARAARLLARWRAAVSADPDAHADEQPLEAARRVSSKSLWEDLARLPADGSDAPLIAGLRRWVYELLQGRLGHADEVAWARVAATPLGLVEGNEPRRMSWREAWREVVRARTPAEARPCLAAAAAAGPQLAVVAARAAERRTEVARRLQGIHPWEPIVAQSAADVRRTAARFLDATDDIARSLRIEQRHLGEGVAAQLVAGVARDAGDGWPPRLTRRWLYEAFRAGPSGLNIEPPPLPAAVGAASFARGLCMFGFAMRVATASGAMPFAVAHEPGFAVAYRQGFVFGSLAADPVFQEQALGLGRRRALMQARSLARTALMEARLHAARIVLSDDGGPAPRERFEEICVRLFGEALDPGLRGAWPRARRDEPARWIGLLQATALRESLRHRFDVDWFRNPHAWADLRAQGALAARESVEGSIASGAEVDALARAFENALG